MWDGADDASFSCEQFFGEHRPARSAFAVKGRLRGSLPTFLSSIED